MDISIIVPCYKSEHTIDICINSILGQNFNQQAWELIIVDDTLNNSSLDKYENKENITVIKNNKNLGLAASRNVGINNSTGNLLIFIDSDMELEKGWVESALNTMKDSSIVGLMGKYKLPENLSPNLLDKYLYSSIRGANSKINEPLFFRWFLFSNTIIRRNALKDGFDENIKSYGGEDTELALRIYQKFPEGLRCTKGLICYHHDQKELSEFCNNMKNYGKINLPYIINKHPDFKSDFIPNWAISGLGGYLVFNSLIFMFAKLLLIFFPIKYLIRYQVIFNVITGYRLNNKNNY